MQRPRPSTRARAAGVAAILALATAVTLARHPAARAQDARVELPTEWRLSPPTGPVRTTGTLPTSTTLTADGAHLIVDDTGAGTPQIQIMQAGTLELERTIPASGLYGVPLADRTGTGFWVSTAAEHTIVHIDAATGLTDRTIDFPAGFWASSIARSPDGTTLAVADDSAHLAFVDLRSGAVAETEAFGAHLADAAYAPDGKTVYVASWGGSSVFAVDATRHRVRAELPVGKHPEHLATSPDGRRLYVSEPDDDAIGIVDLTSGKVAGRIAIGLFGGALGGASPTSLALDATGARLYVTCSAANAIVVLAPAAASGAARETLIGAIPTGWYPTSVTLDPARSALYVADGMGESGRPNPQFRPFSHAPGHDLGYIAKSMVGSIRYVAIPDDTELASGVATVAENGGPFLGRSLHDPKIRAEGPQPDGSVSIVRRGGPIQHVIYIIKENRTYDQVLGDEPAADGDPALTLFGRAVTPNEHAIARRFGIFDRTFADAEVSADGHNWSTAAFANDYLEKMWPQNYGNRRKGYDFEDGATASVPLGGYIWNVAKRAGVTLRNYGEFTSEPGERQPVPGEKASADHDDITSSMPDLKDETDPRFPGFDLDVSDLTRYAEWRREYDADAAAGTMPAIALVRLPNDHTAGTRAGQLAPAAFVAQNDDAVGRLVVHVSHGKYWSSTAIFVLEDDAQNGADHVDAQRMTFYLASPYAAGGVQHAHYSTAGVLRTIEMFFGLPPMSTYDAAARPLTAAFRSTPDLRPYDALPETQSETVTNAASAYRARANLRYDLSREDAFPSGEMNDEIWHAVAGRAAPRVPSERNVAVDR